MSRIHVLKTWPEPFSAILRGAKRYEVRKNDRGFAVGDVLHLKEWDPTPTTHRPTGDYTGRELDGAVTYITHGGSFGLPADLCVMAIAVGGVKE